MRRRLLATSLVTLSVWVAVAWFLARPLNVHAGMFFLHFASLVIWVLGVPIGLSLWIRRAILGESRRGKSWLPLAHRSL